jgi:hypothetical protein
VDASPILTQIGREPVEPSKPRRALTPSRPPVDLLPIRGSDGKTRMVRMGTWGPGAAVSAPPAASPQPAGRAQFAAWKKPSKVASGWPGWLFLIGLVVAVVAWRRKRSRS